MGIAGLDNQLLCGTACVGIITLVVAIDGKQKEPLTMPELEGDDPDVPDGGGPIFQMKTLRERWQTLSKKDNLTLQECHDIERDMKVFDDYAMGVYKKENTVIHQILLRSSIMRA